MRTVFGSWKYCFKNLWFLLPFAVLPALFLSLSLDFSEISAFVRAFFSGNPKAGFLNYFFTVSIVRVDILGAVYSVCAFACTSFFLAFMLCIVEKHMRLGKRTPNGAFSQLGTAFLFALLITFLYLVLYEIWAVVLSAILFAVASVGNTIIVYVLDVFVFLLSSFALLYICTAFYLWFPCRQKTGFGSYDSFVYSYRLMTGVRWKLVLAFSMSFVAASVLVVGTSFLGEFVFRIACFAGFLLLFLDFGVRMETVYFETDKLDREDLLRSYRELL